MMKFLSFMLALAMAHGVLSTTGCDANDCARAVTGTRTGKMPDVTSRMEDCSSFMLVTVTPATSTATAYTTVTDTITLPGMKRGLQERQVTVVPSSTPSYALACSTPGAYSSACSCWGITATTTTAPTPVTTTTVTIIATATACPVSDTLCGTSCYNLQTDPNNCGTCGNSCVSGVCDSGSCTNPACAGETCSTFTFTCSPNSNCFCVQTAEGDGACATNNSCDNPSCSSTSDCPPDTVCAINSCCGSSGTCTGSVSACEPNSPSRMLARDYVNGSLAFPGVWVD